MQQEKVLLNHDKTMKYNNHLMPLKMAALIWSAVELLSYSEQAQASCGSSFCLVNTDWAVQGAWMERGYRYDLRFETVRQDQLMRGSKKVNLTGFEARNAEQETDSRRWLLNVDHGINENWGVSAAIPFIDRNHQHAEAGQPVTWSFRQVGDARITARYQTGLQDKKDGGAVVVGAHVGIKLATGKFDIANLTGTKAERSLQPGTGTNDLLASVYYRRVLSDIATTWFVQANLEAPLQERDGFKPGRKIGVDLGIRTLWTSSLSPMLQLNFQHRASDSGIYAEPTDSGGRSLSISPGLSYKITPQTHAYGFVQVPVYQQVTGQQLSPKWAATVGIQSHF